MRHTSIKMNTPIEFINVTEINPLISKCQIKVCYVSDKSNRNRTVITKDVAKKIANTIPGSPIVGKFNKEKNDFEEHNRIMEISEDGKITFSTNTQPYGFVDLNAKVWFQKFLDDGINEHEYLMTEGYLWTGQFPESKRIIDKGNNHSMELDKETLNGFWTRDDNCYSQFFIINEAIMSKLCILGDDEEPCFEGGGIAQNYVNFHLDDNFKNELFSLMEQMKEILNKGGAPVFNKFGVEIGDSLWTSVYGAIDNSKYSIHGFYENEDSQKFVVLSEAENNKFYKVNFSNDTDFSLSEEYEDITDSYSCEAQFSKEDIDAFYAVNIEESVVNKKVTIEEPAKAVYVLDEIPEYVEMKNNYAALEISYNELTIAHNELKEQVDALLQFKLEAERKQKQEMIDSFYMLNDEDKKDVIDNIDKYSIDDIEAKLSIICVRNKVSFDLDKDNKDSNSGSITYNLDTQDLEDNSIPAWVKALQANSKSN